MGTKLIETSGVDFAQQNQNWQNPPWNPHPGTESSDLTPMAFTGARSAPVARPKAAPILSKSNLMTLCLDVRSLDYFYTDGPYANFSRT